MRKLLMLVLLAATPLLAQSKIDGDWLLTTDVFGNPLHQKLVLKNEGDKLTGQLGGTKLEGTIAGTQLQFTLKDEQGGTAKFTGTLSGDTISGSAMMDDFITAGEHITRAFTATRVPQNRPGAPQRHDFTPTVFHRQFSAANAPVLKIWPGDTIHTTTVDAAGVDEKGVPRVLGGNPQTGPFYVEGAMPGDTLKIHLDRIRLNRDYAISDDGVVPRATGPQFAIKMKDNGKTVRWKLDRERMLGTPEKPGEHMHNYTVPLRPMLGCVAVAPGFGSAPPPTGDSGRFGGNMDFNEIVEGTTVYLPISQPGALLYVGDGHAVQGDGELNGDALETSMDVEFTVDLLRGRSAIGPRVESSTHVMAMGLAGSLDDAIKIATANLGQWLEQDYGLTASEIAEVLGSSAEYVVSEVADRNAGIVAKLNKQRLAGLTKSPPKPDSK